jgi:very-short-patch-repair endonuclease
MRSLYFTAADSGMTRAQLRHAESKGTIVRVGRAIYRHGGESVTTLDRCLALVVATDGVASGSVAGTLHGLDAVTLVHPDVSLAPNSSHKRSGVRRRALIGEVVDIGGIRCASALQTLVDLAATLDDDRWEQALESALRLRLTTVAEIEKWLPELGRRRTPGVSRIKRVLALRPTGAPPTGSILETMFVQLRRRVPGSTEPVRQFEVRNRWDEFVAFVDLCWPELGLFIELDGQHHAGQPVHDARRETAVIAATGWLVGRFTWDEVTRHPAATARRLAELIEQARRRPLPTAA